MNCQIEIYPSQNKINIFSLIKENIENNTIYSKYSEGLTFEDYVTKKTVTNFKFELNNIEDISINKVISPYSDFLYVDASQINEVFTASDIIENLLLSNGVRVDTYFIEKFEKQVFIIV